jgi:hypothetical protein
MRTKLGMVVVLAVGTLLMGACSDDGGDADDGSGDSGGSGGGASAEEALADDPSPDECVDALLTVLGRVEVPEGFDPSDGVDDDERAAAQGAMDDASEGLFDPNDEDHPCTTVFDEISDEQGAEILGSVDPAVIAMLGSLAEAQFVPIEGEL